MSKQFYKVPNHLEFYVNRDNLQNNLDKFLISESNAHAATKIVNIHGIGGAGKTQLAVNYCYRKKEFYNQIIWLISESPSLLSEQYSQYLSCTGTHIKHLNMEQVIYNFKQEFEKSSKWLLVYDNADNFHDILECFPRVNGHIIVTSRAPIDVHMRIHVDMFEVEEARAFTKMHFNCTEREFKIISSKTNNYPLVIDKICHYFSKNPVSIEKYFGVNDKNIIKKSKKENHNDKEDILLSPLKKSLLSDIKKIRKENNKAYEMLLMCCFLSADNIALDLLVEYFNGNEAEMHEAISELKKYSLVNLENDFKNISMHRLVQSMIIGTLDSQEQCNGVTNTAKLLHDCCGFSNHQWEQVIDVKVAYPLRHYNVLLKHAQLLQNVASSDIFCLCSFDMALIYGSLGNNLEKLRILQGIYDHSYLNNDLVFRIIFLNHLGVARRYLGEFLKASMLYEEAVDLLTCNQKTCNTHVKSVTFLNMGVALRYQKKINESISVLRQAITICPKGKNILRGAILANLGNVYKDIKRYKIAQRYYYRAISVQKKFSNELRSEVARTYNSLGHIFQEKKNYPKARSYYIKSYEIKKDIFSDRHPQIGITTAYLGLLALRRGEYTEAIRYLKGAYQIALDFHPPIYFRCLIRMYDLAVSYYAVKNYNKSYQLLTELKDLLVKNPNLSLRRNFCDLDTMLDTIKKNKLIMNAIRHEERTSSKLTVRENECMKLILKGVSAKEAASILRISQRTVESHLYNIRKKMNCRSTLELVSCYKES